MPTDMHDRCLQVREPTSEQAHVPAQQPPTGEDPRLPPADAYPSRSRDPRGPALQGAHQAVGLTDVLPAGSRLRRRADFTSTLRRSRGVRAGGVLIVHVAAADDADLADPVGPIGVYAAPQVGFVVSRAVGPAVTRNRVRRRLRHLAAGRLGELAAGTRVVIRALPASATATSAQLDAALGGALAVPRAASAASSRPVTRP